MNTGSELYHPESESFLKKHKRSEENFKDVTCNDSSSFRRKSFNPNFKGQELEEGEVDFTTHSSNFDNLNNPSSPQLKSLNSITSSLNLMSDNSLVSNGFPKKKLDLKDLLKKKKHTDSKSDSSSDKNNHILDFKKSTAL